MIGSELTEGTVELIKRALTTGITTATGLRGFDLTKPAKSLIPVETPFRNRLSRTTPEMGATAAQWRTLLNVNQNQGNPAVPFDYAGPEVVFAEQDMLAPYAVLEFAGLVTRDAVNLARGFDDARARARLGVLQQVMIGEDHHLVGGQRFALPTPSTPTVANSTTGGSISGTPTVYVKVAARTGENYFYGGGTVPSAAGNGGATSGSTASATASIPAVKGAVAYDWYVGSASGTVYYYKTTTIAQVTITAIPTADGNVPISLPLVYNAGNAGDSYATANAADRSADPAAMNGFLATLTGDYSSVTQGQVTAGTGTPSGAVWIDNGGGTLTAQPGGIAEIDALLLAVYQAGRLSPTALMVNAVQAGDMSTKAFANGQAVTYLVPNDTNDKSNIAMGGYVGKYLNKSMGGLPVLIETHPSVPPGTIIARSDTVPYPNSDIGSVLEVRTLEDYADIPYASPRIPAQAGGGPREEFAVRSMETLVNYAPVAHGVLTNVKNG